jgi:hypothetical protein
MEDRKVWKTGNSFVVSLDSKKVKRYNIKSGDLIDIDVVIE